MNAQHQPPFLVLDWRPMQRNTLRGFARIQMPSGMVINEVSIHIGGAEARAWASPPSRPMMKDGVALTGDDGKVRYQALVEFSTKQHRDKWSAAVVAALQAAHPEVFDA